MAESSQHLHPRSATTDDEVAHESHGISINLPPGSHDGRPPPPVKHMSAPAYQSPIRHHRRTPSRSKGVKETLNARSHYGSSDDDGGAVHRINQYMIKQEIGRGSFGSVHLAEDQYGNEYAVKEFSKSRLRKRAQSNLLRKPNRRPGQLAAGVGFNSPMHRVSSSEANNAEANNSLDLIKEEIAIMKKLNHNNLVSLFEVLDDPQEDSLYMVLEMCKKGVAMKVGLDERATPYDDETCRCWFRDMILGIEYLHAQGIVHRDIKPDNCLITDEDVLKIVDFGVSEMFEKQSDMTTAKSAGSPAFMPPELCVARHGQVSGRAADIWSMGVTLFCLRYGHIPFEKGSMIELYDSIREDDVVLDKEQDANFKDLMKRLLEKDPETRISMEEIRNHPWVTKDGTDTLLSAEDNCADIVAPPTEIEMNHAITGNMGNVLAVVGAVKRFKHLLHDKRGRFIESMFGQNSRLVTPPHSIERTQTRSQDTHDRRPMDKILVTSGVHRPIDVNDDLERLPENLDKVNVHESPDIVLDTSESRGANETEAHYKQRMETRKHQPEPDIVQSPVEEDIHPRAKRATTFPAAIPIPHAKGHAHDPLEDMLYLDIGHDPEMESGEYMLSESPGGVDWNIYEQAYQEEMERILQRRGREPSIYMNRRIEHREDIGSLAYIKDAGRQAARAAVANFDRLYALGYAKGSDINDAGRTFARSAAGKMYAQFPSSSGAESRGESLEAWKQWARSGARDGYDASRYAANRASEKLGGLYARHASEGGSYGFTNLVNRAQAKARGGTPGDVPINTSSPTTTAPDAPARTPPPAIQTTETETPTLPLLKAETDPPALEARSPSPNPGIKRKPVPSPSRKAEEKKTEEVATAAPDVEPAESSSPIAMLKRGGFL